MPVSRKLGQYLVQSMDDATCSKTMATTNSAMFTHLCPIKYAPTKAAVLTAKPRKIVVCMLLCSLVYRNTAKKAEVEINKVTTVNRPELVSDENPRYCVR